MIQLKAEMKSKIIDKENEMVIPFYCLQSK